MTPPTVRVRVLLQVDDGAPPQQVGEWEGSDSAMEAIPELLERIAEQWRAMTERGVVTKPPASEMTQRDSRQDDPTGGTRA